MWGRWIFQQPITLDITWNESLQTSTPLTQFSQASICQSADTQDLCHN